MINALYFQQRIIPYALPSILLLLEAPNSIFNSCCEEIVLTGNAALITEGRYYAEIVPCLYTLKFMKMLVTITFKAQKVIIIELHLKENRKCKKDFINSQLLRMRNDIMSRGK
jgi:hypothetical protein